MDNKKTESDLQKELPATPIMGQPENVFELINKYGTYEIQPTNDSDNRFPKIAQGLSKREISESTEKRDNIR
ncbi:MAG: hypothetical protein IKK24_04785 [Clostridia bacterium]|nr:hypothetical protein [Clostridia bacterium]